jgi:hypothetical protein
VSLPRLATDRSILAPSRLATLWGTLYQCRWILRCYAWQCPELPDRKIKIAVAHLSVMLLGNLFSMSADFRCYVGRKRSCKISRSRSSQIVPEPRPLLHASSANDLYEIGSKVRLSNHSGEDVFRPVFGFVMKLQKLGFDLREQRDCSDRPSAVMLRLRAIDDEDPLRLRVDMLPFELCDLAWHADTSQASKYQQSLPVCVRGLV